MGGFILRSLQIRAAFETACWEEIAALKPGNVHIFADGHGMVAAEFLISAQLAAPEIANSSAGVGARIEAATHASFGKIGKNINLGILLLCAPLAAAAQIMQGRDLRAALALVLAGLNIEDAQATYRAIAQASPGGLGQLAEHDVRHPPQIGLLEAMAIAAPRDRIASQYVTDFDDVFDLGLPAIWYQQGQKWGAVSAYLEFLAAFPDSHVVRKYDKTIGAEVQQMGIKMRDQFNAKARPSATMPALMALDRSLKARQLNPGTSADLTVASLFAAKLMQIT